MVITRTVEMHAQLVGYDFKKTSLMEFRLILHRPITPNRRKYSTIPTLHIRYLHPVAQTR